MRTQNYSEIQIKKRLKSTIDNKAKRKVNGDSKIGDRS